ncbi:MAG TPA: glycosyltransferase family 2 protein [Armatimonadota bacterium]|jgi:glycosyltransferase involved in cell wall biosynthesis
MTLSLTACIPNYNHSQYLPEAIEAVLGQSRPPEEFLLLDDASTDTSVEIMESYAQRCPYLRVAQNERNLGVVASLDRLLRAATGDYVYFGAADDYVLPGFLEHALALAERHPEAAIVFGQIALRGHQPGAPDSVEIRGVRRWTEPLYASPEVFLRDYLQAEPTWHSLTHATIYRRDLFLEEGGFRRELGHLCDTFALRALALRYGACYLPEPGATWRLTPHSYAAGEGRELTKMLGIIEKLGELMRSAEFRDRFPASYARRWEGDLQRMVFDHYLWTIREPWGRSPGALLRGRLLKRYLLARVALAYRGDLAAFLKARLPGLESR